MRNPFPIFDHYVRQKPVNLEGRDYHLWIELSSL